MCLVHVIFKQPALRVLLVTLVTFHKFFGSMDVSYVVLQLLESFSTMGTSLLHVEVDCSVVCRAIASLSESLHTTSSDLKKPKIYVYVYLVTLRAVEEGRVWFDHRLPRGKVHCESHGF